MRITELLTEGPTPPSGVITAYHVGNGFEGDFDLSKSGSGEGMRVLGPGVYFSTNQQLAMSYRRYAKQNPTLYTVEININGFHNFSIWDMTEDQISRWNALAIELGYPSFGKMGSPSNAMKNGWNQVGVVVERVGDQKARELFIKHGITGAMEQSGGANAWELCAYDLNTVRIVDRQPIGEQK